MTPPLCFRKRVTWWTEMEVESYCGCGYIEESGPIAYKVRRTKNKSFLISVPNGKVFRLQSERCSLTNTARWWRGTPLFSNITQKEETLMPNRLNPCHCYPSAASPAILPFSPKRATDNLLTFDQGRLITLILVYYHDKTFTQWQKSMQFLVLSIDFPKRSDGRIRSSNVCLLFFAKGACVFESLLHLLVKRKINKTKEPRMNEIRDTRGEWNDRTWAECMMVWTLPWQKVWVWIQGC